MLHRFSFSALVCAILAFPTVVAAESFFDIFTDISLEDTTCSPCAAIEDDSAFTKALIDEREKDLQELDMQMEQLERDMEEVSEAMQAAEESLQEFVNPQSYVESEGRRYDSADHTAMQRRSANLWSAYTAGDMTAQEYSDAVSKPFDDPSIQTELSKLKKEIQKEMEERIKNLKKQKEDTAKKLSELDELGREMTDELDALHMELLNLQSALEECEKQCKEGTELDPTAFGVEQSSRGFFGWISDLFEKPTSSFPGMDAFISGLGPTDIVPIEMVELQLQSVQPITVIPPSKCHMCDPLANDIAQKEAQISNYQNQLSLFQEQAIKISASIVSAEYLLDETRQKLEQLLNPPSFVESEGRRYDSSTHAAMQVRNARLWAEYKSGKLSSSQLEAEWSKPFDDPGVAKELEKITQQMQKELNTAIETLKETIETLRTQRSTLEVKITDTQQNIGDAQVQLAGMRKAYELCVQQCSEVDDAIDFIDGLLKDGSPWVSLSEALCTGKDQYETGSACSDVCYKNVPAGEQHLCHRAPEAQCWSCLSCPKGADYSLKTCEATCNGTCNDIGNGCFQCESACEAQGKYDTGSACSDVCYNNVPAGEQHLCHRATEAECWSCLSCPKGSSYSMKSCESTCDGTCNDVGNGCFQCESTEQEDNISNEDDVDESISRGIFCDWFGVFCPKQEFMLKDTDIPIDPQFFLKGPAGSEFPLTINGLDGNDTLDPEDVQGLSNCISGAPQNCVGLDFGVPGDDILFGDDLLNSGPGDFQVGLRGQDGRDVLFGDPVGDDFINVGGGSTDLLHGGPDDLLGDPSNDRLFGPSDDIIGGPPGIDIFGHGGDETVPPPPSSSEPSVANDARARQVAQAAVQAYLRQNPLGPCEKLVVQVSRVRIGNRVRYTVKITRVFDEALCPVETEDDEDDIDLGCQFDEDCNDGDECTQDRCDRNTNECSNEFIEGCGDPVCGNGVKEVGEDCEQGIINDCDQGQQCNAESCTCETIPVPTSSHTCPDLSYPTEAACKGECSMGECEYRQFDDYFCFFCAPKDLPPPSSSSRSSQKSVEEQCDSPTMKKSDCNRTCDGTCDKAYSTISGMECFECVQTEPVPACGDGRIDPGEECDLNGCDVGQRCAPDCTCQQDEDALPSCPSGSTDSKSTCDSQCSSQGGVCIEEDGCYSCVVVNCPDGTYKNECPSNCSNGCEVVGSQHGVSCYQCTQSCEDVCAQNGYGGPGTDHSDAILSELNGYSCVSGANISIQTATIGSCSCIGEYSLSVDQTPPVCSGTPCGDVQCGSSASCADGDTQITVNCNWGGWEKIGKEQFRPKLGN